MKGGEPVRDTRPPMERAHDQVSIHLVLTWVNTAPRQDEEDDFKWEAEASTSVSPYICTGYHLDAAEAARKAVAMLMRKVVHDRLGADG